MTNMPEAKFGFRLNIMTWGLSAGSKGDVSLCASIYSGSDGYGLQYVSDKNRSNFVPPTVYGGFQP